MKISNELELLETSILIPYVRNSRTHSDAQVQQIASSIKEFGFTNPILIDESNGIIAGHGRLLAAQLLKIKSVPCIRLGYLSESQKRAYVIADNKLALNAGWDDALLSLELKDLQLNDFDLSLTGFNEDELAKLLVEAVKGQTDPDDVPEIQETAITVLGDIWTLGKHRLMCGDSTSIDDFDRLVDGKKANLAFTSPPYNAGSLNIAGQKGTQKKYNSFDDNKTESEFFEFLSSNMKCLLSVCDEVFYNIGLVENNKRTIIKLIDTFNYSFKDIIYWKKKTVAPHIQKGIINNLVEFIICFGDGKRKFLNAQFNQGTYWNVIEGPNASGNEFAKIHKATFPVYLPENIINNFTSRNAIIIDCFGGTGTTMIACEKNDRSCFMMELDPKYCDVIIRRWQNFTGSKALHSETEKTFEEIADERSNSTS